MQAFYHTRPAFVIGSIKGVECLRQQFFISVKKLRCLGELEIIIKNGLGKRNFFTEESADRDLLKHAYPAIDPEAPSVDVKMFKYFPRLFILVFFNGIDQLFEVFWVFLKNFKSISYPFQFFKSFFLHLIHHEPNQGSTVTVQYTLNHFLSFSYF